MAINQMIDFLLSDKGAEIRQQLSEKLVDEVDRLGVDAFAFAAKNVGQVNQVLVWDWDAPPRALSLSFPAFLKPTREGVKRQASRKVVSIRHLRPSI